VTVTDKIAFKNRLKQAGGAIIEQRIAAARTIIANAQEAANSEEKSSAGDKYETARAMGHLEREMHEKQLAQQINELALLRSVKTEVMYDTAVTGACVVCDGLLFFIAAGLGKQTVDGVQLIYLSPQAPLAKLLWLKKAGEQFVFNGAQTTITAVY
jgi:hypothetical protein